VASSDVAILNYALSLEYLQASFYTEAERIGALHGALAHQATVVGMHERAHVAAFHQLLGSAAIKQPKFDFHGVTESADAFRKTAVAFEDLAVAAYKGQAPRLASKSYLAGAIAIHSVEARHAAWIRRLAGFLPAAKAFDEPLSAHKVVEIVNSTHFVTLRDPDTSAEASPRFTG
jgi:rubrerythrin